METPPQLWKIEADRETSKVLWNELRPKIIELKDKLKQTDLSEEERDRINKEITRLLFKKDGAIRYMNKLKNKRYKVKKRGTWEKFRP